MERYAYQMYEMLHLAFAPARAMSEVTVHMLNSSLHPFGENSITRSITATAELFERMTRRYGKPAFGFHKTVVDGVEVPIVEEEVWRKPFCRLLRFRREFDGHKPRQSKLLLVAPMSGHYATLLRGTVEAFLPSHDVYITDWADARAMAVGEGRFDLDEYIDYLIEISAFLSQFDDDAPVHTLGVCQASVPLICAVAAMEAAEDPHIPASMVLMGGPIDPRVNPTAVNRLAQKRGIRWFKQHCIHTVPFPHAGWGRSVYPGFLQLSGFMAMNIERHVSAHLEMFEHLVEGDGDSAEKHRDFYDEYLAVMDLTAEFYLQTVEQVFIRHAIPLGLFHHRAARINLAGIRRTALLTVEGEKDDISGVGQTYAAQELCANIPQQRREHYLQEGVGHYGVFNGSRFRREIAPRIQAFTARIEKVKAAAA
ncbi:polyhydroxyalkanoate depolymerase [Methylocystis bryophila]|uniref:Polyhydroxyalkanoate depolymerase n=1 Tax=Methylocystis bryophila TaxID=655015 RepID=A0A1W6MYL8_9HYPH|nr:polyhydroxyalkanoate depolymerase [Methylocystis bryophila]ARN82629.1 polyhydroxyalkanoate depolymerase [Methylocystis bryophila]BDV38842.1 esterase [Methylocystis bryophila]